MMQKIPLVKDSLLYAPLVMLEQEVNASIGLLPARLFVDETPPLLIVNGDRVVAVMPDRYMCSAIVAKGKVVVSNGVVGYVWESVELKKFDKCYLPPKIIRLLEKYFVDGGEPASNS